MHTCFGSLAFSVVLISPGVLAAETPPADNAPVARFAYLEKLSYAGLPNFAKVNDSLYRGAQPNAEGFQQLKRLGIATIIDLRREEPGKVEWERQQSQALGMRFLHLPVSGWSTPSDEQVARFFAIIRSSGNEKIFVHCHFGEDRTGVFIASYRIAFDHWSANQAVNEMLAFGFNRWWHPSMASYVRNLASRLQRDPLLKSALAPQVSAPSELAR
jgi:tyrosine-protein phosphatase SIW14